MKTYPIFMKTVLVMSIYFSVNILSADNFVFTPPKEFGIDPKFIAVHHPVKTNNPAAQIYFDQGLTQLYAFNNDSAYWSFLNASKLDPEMPMAYWGMALALGPNLQGHKKDDQEIKNKQLEAIRKALDLSANGSEAEREYIHALAKKYDNKDIKADKAKEEYSKAIENLSKKYPDDPDAAVFWAESILDLQEDYWKTDGTPFPGIIEAEKILENTLIKNPNHIGANHYYIHLIDGSPYPEKGLRAAERLQTLLPTSGHLLHMPSHIYILVGEYHKAALTSEEALAADRQYVNTYGMVGSYPRDYISHSLYFLSRVYCLEERFGDGKRTADELRYLYLSNSQHMPKMEHFAVMPLFILIHFHKWEEILQFQKPADTMVLANLLWRFSRALAFANLKKTSETTTELRAFEEAKKQVLTKKLFQEENMEKMIEILGCLIKAKVAENESRINDSIDFLQKGINEQTSLAYNESVVWFLPCQQYLGALYLKLQKYQDAEQVYRENLKIIPNNSRSLFGLKESLAAQSQNYDLFWVNKAFQNAFKYSDINLSIDNL